MAGRPDSPETFWQEEDGTLVVEWSDGHQSRLSSEILRAACPCAACHEERLAGLREGSGSPPKIRAIERVGRYALNLVWSDGHRAGIYPWPLLRKMCGCFACRLEKGES